MKNANHFFGSHNGSENFFCHKPSLILYTDGVKELAEGRGCLLADRFDNKPPMPQGY
ncbi:MAG: hypothetical protein IPM10_02820 [Chitinophagaceae bacterium]|nr:hypothetical protein [Chitinophagaceae bacterium]